MQVIVKARHMTLTPALTRHAQEKLGICVMRVFDRPGAKIDIELSDLGAGVRDGEDKECRVTMFMPKGKPIVICEVDDNMYKAIDLAHHRLLTRVKRERGRKNDTSTVRKHAARDRALTARGSLTADREAWEDEVVEFEQSVAHA